MTAILPTEIFTLTDPSRIGSDKGTGRRTQSCGTGMAFYFLVVIFQLLTLWIISQVLLQREPVPLGSHFVVGCEMGSLWRIAEWKPGDIN